ncbi:MAG: hypothetical protein C4574_00680 [Candidatus Latescibacterota bacterium]|nr:MAG: hypothetical protein C4574_00680 [Candidatus Latescibacterota bacterium]
MFDPLVTWPELDLAKITNTALYSNLAAIFTPIRKTIRGVRGSITRKYYKVDFVEFHPVDDAHKHFDMDDCLVIRRTEEEAVLVGKTIIDLRLYDGETEYDYRKDTSFLIVAENVLDATEKTVFAWHNNRLYPTIFGDYWNGKEYEITFCFQIFETPDDVEVRNYDAWDDSEMVGSLTYQDKTSKVIVL